VYLLATLLVRLLKVRKQNITNIYLSLYISWNFDAGFLPLNLNRFNESVFKKEKALTNIFSLPLTLTGISQVSCDSGPK
jgi:uncharacterized SAM-binding protein YcdF (DUF218 family)